MPTAAANLWSRNADQLEINMHEGQLRAWDSEARFVFVLAGTQGGKTSWAPWWLWREITTRGAGDYLAVSATYDLFKLKMLPALQEVFEHVFRWGRYWASERIIELADPATGKFAENGAPMWGRIILRSADARGGLESATAKGAWLDECGQDGFTVEAWEAVQRRLTLNQGRALGTTTPYNLGWVKTAVYDRWLAGDTNYDIVQFASTSNPMFPRAEYERARDTMPAWRFAMFYKGEFARPAGLIYEAFDPERHVVDWLPTDEPRWVGVDFGAVNTSTVWLAHDTANNRYVVYRETLEGGMTTRQHVARHTAHLQGTQLTAAYGGAGSEEQQRMDWTEAGLTVRRPLIADVEPGIDRVSEMLRTNRMAIHRSCHGILDEIGSYRRKVDAGGNPTDEIEAKREYHRLDALRYVCSGVVVGGVKAGPDILG